MYPLKGSNAYGQQSYSAQQPYSHPSGGSVYPGTQISTPDGTSQHAMVSRQNSMLNSSQEADVDGYRVHSSQASHYSGPYASVYGSSAQQMTGKASGSSSLQGRATYSSVYPDSSKFGSGAPSSGSIGMTSEEYMTSGYGHKVDLQYSTERRHYDDRQSAYVGRDDTSLQSQKSEAREQYDQALLYRQQQMMKVQSLQPGPDARQPDYLAARAATMHHGHADISSPYSGRMDADPRNMSVLGGGPYSGLRSTSILGGPSRSNIDHVYRVGVPPGRDYDAPIQGRISSQGGFSGFHEELKDDRSIYQREVDLREERRRELVLREREKEREKELERERERERERDRERLRERERLKERERERERERQRLREREREREKERLQKQREKEKERERDKRGSELSRQERRSTPPRTSKDRQVSSATRDERSSRSSPRRDNTSHRRHSPVKDRRREYVCKVSPLSLADPVRDYMALAKRYPRLSISPEFSKVVVNWPKEKLNISLYLPVSFQHEFEVDNEQKDLEQNTEDSQKSKSDSTIWNAKVILMSGISDKVLEEFCGEQNSADRISHFNNLLKFAILRKDHSFKAIGGPWNAALDGGDPSTDDSSLVRTAKRYLKDSAKLDLENCQHWNKFIEIHYNRFGKDGLQSHREITVLYLPDLSNCLPSVDQWRSQWLAHKTAGAEKQKKLNETDLSQGGQKRGVSEPFIDHGNSEAALNLEKPVNVKETLSTKYDEIEAVKEIGGDIEAAKEDETSTQGMGNEIQLPLENQVIKHGDNNSERHEDPPKQVVKEPTPSTTNVRTFVRKKVIKKVPVKTTSEEGETLVEKTAEHEPEAAKTNCKVEQEGTVQEASPPKGVVKKRVVRKVIKKKVVTRAGAKRESAESESKDDGKTEQAGGAIISVAVKTEVEEAAAVTDERSGIKSESSDANNEKNGEDIIEEEKKPKIDEPIAKEQVASKKLSDSSKQEEDGSKKKAAESKQKPAKEYRDRRPPDAAAPEHPGFFFQIKQTKESKVRSISLSLDGLLDYNQKDTEESTFELSLFAESLNEMIQFEMGHRLLSFLQKLRTYSLARKSQLKRERDETARKEDERESLSAHKRLKSADDDKNEVENECPPQSVVNKEENSTLDHEAALCDAKKEAGEEEKSAAGEENKSVEEQAMEEDDLEDPEELSDYDQEMDETPPDNDVAASNQQEEAAVNNNKASEPVPKNEQEKSLEDDQKPDIKEVRHESEQDVVDRDLLQAFRYFDRNRVGYLKVEDLRLIIHNLGLFLSHKEVKELVQSALSESSGSSRDNRIVYHKLVRIASL